jgi:anti-sigma regulatory factor (Ser/Thr protein kinase)
VTLHERQKGVALVCTSADGRRLVHHGLLHPPSADLAEILAPLIAERLARGEPVLAVLPPTTAAQLQGRLPTLTGLHTADPGGLYRHPGRVLGHYLSWIGKTSPGEPATIVAAPELGEDDSHRAALWMHIEALTTQALAEYDLTLVCTYPNDPSTALTIRQAHPSLLNGAVTPSPDHLPAEQFLAGYPLPPPSELGQPDLTHIIDHPSQLTRLRQVIASHVARAGLPATRCEDFVLAVTEVATNALEHGAPPAAVCLWTTSASVICQITDNGRFTQPLAGLLPPRANQYRARGLWIAHQLCDQFYLWPEPTTIRLQMDRPQITSPGPADTRS